MDMNEADISAGSAKSVPAKHYAMYDMDKLADCIQKYGINFV
jgi:hypothetical protein